MKNMTVLPAVFDAREQASEFIKTTEVARLTGCNPSRVRQIVVENQIILKARKASGCWEVAVEAVPILASLLKEAGEVANARILFLWEKVGLLNHQIQEITEENQSLKSKNEELNNHLVESVKKAQVASDALANRALDVAISIAENPKKESPKKEDAWWAFKLGPLDGKIPPALVPIIAAVALFGSGMWVRNLQAKKESEFLGFAGDQIQTTMKTIAEARQSAERSLDDEKKRLAEKEKSLKESEALQKDITEQLTQKKVEVAQLGTMTQNLEEKVESLNGQIELLEKDRSRRESLEKELQATLLAQKTVAKSQEDVIAAQKSELEALKHQLRSFTAASTENQPAGGTAPKDTKTPLASK